MTARPNLHTIASEVAHEQASSDREATARLVLDVAVKEAIKLLRLGSPGKAEWRLARAGMSAQRLLGNEGPRVYRGVTWVTTGSNLPIHTCTYMCGPTTEGCCWAGRRLPHTFRDGVCMWCDYVEGATP